MRRERVLVAALSVAAALRVGALAAAFPLFNPIDEPQHYDLVVKYARGRVPRGLEPFSEEALRAIAFLRSPEYTRRFGSDAAVPPPLWRLPPAAAAAAYRARLEIWRAHGNIEGVQPPLYYLAAAAWWRVGRAARLSEWSLPYWVRLLGALAHGLLVWLSWRWAARLRPSDAFFRLGLPLLVAVFPQQSAYSINADALSPLACGAAFFGLLELRDGRRGAAFHVAVGLASAAALLVKISNIAVAAVLAVVLAERLEASMAGRDRRALAKAAALAAATAVPLLLWATWNAATLGDPTGGAYKARALGWTIRPLSTYGEHPLFAPRGLAYFLNGVSLTFWRGEFWWRGAPLRSAILDGFYFVASWGTLAAASAAALRARRAPAARADAAELFALFGMAVSVLFLVAMSLAYLFPLDGGYPNRADPFLYSGRLIWGMLVPFLVLYLRALDAAAARLRLPRAALLAAVVALVLVGEALVASGAFASRYNWFHGPAPAELL